MEEIIFAPKGFVDHSLVVIHSQPISQVQLSKYLGIYIDRKPGPLM